MLLHKIELYLRRTCMPETRFGREAVGDPNLIKDLRDGRRLRGETLRRIEAFLVLPNDQQSQVHR